MIQDKRYVILEEGFPHSLLLSIDEAEELKTRLEEINPYLSYEIFYDEYYEYIEFYSDEEKEQINRLIP